MKATFPNGYHFGKDPLYSSSPTSYIVPKGSPLQVDKTIGQLPMLHVRIYLIYENFPKEKFKQSIMWLKDTGTLEKVKYDFLNRVIRIPDPKLRHNQPLILKQLGIIMIILVVGLFIATIVFLLELLKKPKLKNASKEKGGIELSTVQ